MANSGNLPSNSLFLLPLCFFYSFSPIKHKPLSTATGVDSESSSSSPCCYHSPCSLSSSYSGGPSSLIMPNFSHFRDLAHAVPLPAIPLHLFFLLANSYSPFGSQPKAISSLEPRLTLRLPVFTGFEHVVNISWQDCEGRAVSAQFTLDSLCLGQNLAFSHYL